MANEDEALKSMKLNILVVDDSRMIRKIMRGILSKAGGNNNIFEASNGKEAERMLQKQKMNFLILDWNMPELNGIDLIKKIKNTPPELVDYGDPCIIMVTSEASKYNMIEALEAGANYYVVKPMKEKDILEILSEETKNKV